MIATLLLTAAAADPDLTICADRPSKANATCTVPADHWQVEISAVDWARTADHGASAEVTAIGQSLVKLGLTDRSDIELGVAPFVRAETQEAGLRRVVSGPGDATIRYKLRLTKPSGATQLAVVPFVKLPTASRKLGNGKVEGGLAVPVSFSIASGPTITIGPELDLLSDGDGRGYHAGIVNLVNLSISPAPRLTVSAELWNARNFDPDGATSLWSADVSAALLTSNRVQLDVGANFGLNRNTADTEFYAGAAFLF